MSVLKKTAAILLSLAMIVTLFAGLGIAEVSAAGGTVVPVGTTVYDFTKLTTKTLAAGTEGFEGFSGTVDAISEGSYVQLKKDSATLSFTVEGVWSATFSSTHSNNAKGTLVKAPDGTIYGKMSSEEGLTLTNMAPGTYTIYSTAASIENVNDGTGKLITAGKNHSYISSIVFTVESSEPPADVTNLTAVADDSMVTLSWTASQAATGYEIYVDGATEAIETDSTSYIIDNLTNDVEHTFVVKAVNLAGSSAGVSVSATPKEPTDPPGAFTLSATAGDSVINLSWTAAQYAVSYDVYRNGSVVASDITAKTYQDSGLTNGTEYTYKVIAKNKNGSTPSAEVTASPVEPAPSDISIVNQQGWLESAYVEWTNPAEVDKYNVYYKGTDDADYVKIDDELVRYYGSYYRADALGLKAGVYTIKIATVKNGAETDSVISDPITVEAQTREGYAFDSSSPYYNSEGVGAYKNDGTLKDNAQVIYVDNTNANTVTHTVMVNGKAYEGVGLVNILALREKNKAETTPLAIRLIGQVTDVDGLNSSDYIQLKATSNVTLEGVGDDATTYGWSILVRDTNNIEIRNLAVMEFYDDGISLDTDNFNDWVHNCDIFYGEDRGGDQKKGDGSLDVKSGSSWVTVAYNHFWDSGKTSLCGMTGDTDEFFVTYHHNWFDHSDSRHARVRRGTVHLYNNYFDGNSKYGVGSTNGSSIFVENNVFRNCKYPVLISMQGSDVAGENEGTFSSENGGIIKMYNNTVSGGYGILNAKDDPIEFDAYIADTRDEKVPETYTTKKGGTTYNNFDTAASMYSYTPTAVESVVSNVEKYAGRIEGGDFNYEFDDAVDDSLYDRNTVLGTMLQNYKTTLVATYTSNNSYPATGGALPTTKPTEGPTADPSLPTATPAPTATPEPQAYPTTWNFGEAPFTVTENDTTHPDTQYFPASDTANRYNITSSSITAENFGGLTFKTSSTLEAQYQSSSKTFADGFKGTWQIKSGGAGSASDKVFKFTPVADGIVTVYARCGSTTAGKDSVLTVQQGTENSTLDLLTTDDGTGSPVLTMNITAGTEVKIYASSNTGFYAIKYEATGEVPTPEPTKNPAVYDYSITSATSTDNGIDVAIAYNGSGTAPTAKLIAASYKLGVLTNAVIYSDDINGSGTYNVPLAVKSGETFKVYLWNDTSVIEPLAAAYSGSGTSEPTTAPTTEPTTAPSTEPTTEPTTEPDDSMNPVSESQTWTFEAAAMESLGTPTTSTDGKLTLTISEGQKVVYDNLYIDASSKDISVDSSNKTVNDVKYTGRLKLGGAGSAEKQYVAFNPAKAGTVSIVVAHASSSGDARTLGVSQNGNEQTQEVVVGDPIVATFDVAAGAPVYIYSKASGLNLYSVIYTAN